MSFTVGTYLFYHKTGCVYAHKKQVLLRFLLSVHIQYKYLEIHGRPFWRLNIYVNPHILGIHSCQKYIQYNHSWFCLNVF